MSNFLQHIAGPGCITYAADAVILQTASEIMRDWLEQQMEQTTCAKGLAEATSTDTIKAGEKQQKQANCQGWSQFAGGVASAGMGVYCLGGTKSTLNELNTSANQMENINDARNALNESPINSAKLTQSPQAETNTTDSFNAAKDSSYETKLTQETKDKLKNLDMANGQEGARLKEILGNKYDTAATQQKILEGNLSKYNTFSQFAQTLSNISQSIGTVYSGAAQLEQAKEEAAKISHAQAQEFAKQSENINSQGAQNTYDQIQKALQSFVAVIAANTRA